MKQKKSNKKARWMFFIAFAVIILSIWGANFVVDHNTETLVYDNVDSIPFNKTGLLLGTSKTLKSGRPNQYFQNRIKATLILFQSGKIDFLIISGDNSHKGYNEPEDMKAELIKNGIPENKIYLDYAGFRTLDSIIRMEKIFGQTHFTIISQEFHNRRALYLAHSKGISAIGFNAEDVTVYNGIRTKIREKLARVKLFLDLWTNKQPKFSGNPVTIE